MHYPNGEMEESTESRLYHMIITIDDNTHSGGVSLQQTKERKYIMSQNQFFSQK